MLRTQMNMTNIQPSEPTPDTPLPEAGRNAAQECAAIEADLERLKKLVNDAAGRLLGSFNEFASLEQQTSRNREERQRIEMAIGSAVTALQFQDMATQLTGHAQRRLVALENCLRTLYGESSAGAILDHPTPVRQAEMSAGSVDLF
jgi:predicted  nucleic acid-binding Zn-ribbon protein